MTLSDFESAIDPKILDRGLEYYEDERVSGLEFNGQYWIAEVDGTESYTVEAEVSKTGEVARVACDCPYDLGPVCKHEAAVLYALREQGAGAPGKTGPAKLALLKSFLNKLPKGDLITLILGLASADRKLRDELLLRFSAEEQSGEADLMNHAERVIKGSIKNAMDRGFVNYRDTDCAAEGALQVLDIARAKSAEGKVSAAVSLCVITLREMVELQRYCDDSNGVIGGVIDEALRLLEDAVAEFTGDGPAGGELFTLIFNHAQEELYDGWDDWRFELLEACVPLCAVPGLRKALETYLNALAVKSKSRRRDDYVIRSIKSLKLRLIKTFDSPDAAEQYIEENLDHPDFRKTAIENAIAGENYSRALELCREGETIDREYPGLVREWRRARYGVYEKQHDDAGQRQLARKFVLNGDFDYYGKFKALYTAKEWTAVLAALLEDLERERYQQRVYVAICVEERLGEKLLAVCRRDPQQTVALYPHLIPQYAGDLDAVFRALIKKEAERSGNREAYRRVCGTLEHYVKACGTTGAKETIAELLAVYRKRPAFVDELHKLNI